MFMTHEDVMTLRTTGLVGSAHVDISCGTASTRLMRKNPLESVPVTWVRVLFSMDFNLHNLHTPSFFSLADFFLWDFHTQDWTFLIN